MDILRKSIRLTDIVYPVFKIGSEIPITEDGVSLFIRQEVDKAPVFKIVDDRNIDQPTMSRRRLQLLKEGVPLKQLGTAIFFLGDLVKIGKPSIWFIDSMGTIFNYKKSTTYKLTFNKITKVHMIPTGGAIIEVEGILSRFKVLFAPKQDEKYAGVLSHSFTHILYGIYKEKYDDTRRMV